MIWLRVFNISLILVLVGLILYLQLKWNKDKKERNLKRRENLVKFEKIELGMSFNEVNSIVQLSPELLKETVSKDNVNIKEYIWRMGQYNSTRMRGAGMLLANGNAGNIAMPATTFSGGVAEKTAYIKAVFEDDKLISKEQMGIGEII